MKDQRKVARKISLLQTGIGPEMFENHSSKQSNHCMIMLINDYYMIFLIYKNELHSGFMLMDEYVLYNMQSGEERQHSIK